jgi:serine protease Do
MKTHRKLALIALCMGAAVVAVPAAETSAPKETRRIAGRPGDEAREAVTFLGVEASPVSPTLTEQLGLPPEMGLVVNSVAPDSPAAGVLKPHDILLKLDDQKLIEARQLRVLVRAHKEGDEVTLTYLRGGKESTAKVKLGKHDAPRVGVMRFPGFGEEGESWSGAVRSGGGVPRDVDRLLPLINMGREMHTRVISPGPEDENSNLTMVNTGNSNLVYTDGDGTLEVKIAEGKKDVVAKNAKGETIFSGPYNTEQERNAAPPAVRERLNKLERMDGVSFRADDDFRPGTFQMFVPEGRRIEYAVPRPAPVIEMRKPAAPML